MTPAHTPTQTYLASLHACAEARAWVGDQTLARAVATCERLDWLRWLATAPARAARDTALATAWDAYDTALAQAWAAYDTATAPADAADLDTLRSMIQIPGDCT